MTNESLLLKLQPNSENNQKSNKPDIYQSKNRTKIQVWQLTLDQQLQDKETQRKHSTTKEKNKI